MHSNWKKKGLMILILQQITLYQIGVVSGKFQTYKYFACKQCSRTRRKQLFVKLNDTARYLKYM